MANLIEYKQAPACGLAGPGKFLVRISWQFYLAAIKWIHGKDMGKKNDYINAAVCCC
jgi:hypothetical protein